MNDEEDVYFDLNEDMEQYYDYSLLDLLEDLNRNSIDNPELYRGIIDELL